MSQRESSDTSDAAAALADMAGFLLAAARIADGWLGARSALGGAAHPAFDQRVLTAVEARQRIELAVAADATARASVVRLGTRLRGRSFQPQHASERELLAWVLGRLADPFDPLVLVCRRPAGIGEEPPLLELPRAPRPAEQLAWLEIELLDEQGEPVAGASYELTLPDGSTRRGKLDDAGFAQLKDVPAGAGHVRFPALARELLAP